MGSLLVQVALLHSMILAIRMCKPDHDLLQVNCWAPLKVSLRVQERVDLARWILLFWPRAFWRVVLTWVQSSLILAPRTQSKHFQISHSLKKSGSQFNAMAWIFIICTQNPWVRSLCLPNATTGSRLGLLSSREHFKGFGWSHGATQGQLSCESLAALTLLLPTPGTAVPPQDLGWWIGAAPAKWAASRASHHWLQVHGHIWISTISPQLQESSLSPL